MVNSTHPLLIQGGMGVAVSAWPLAKAVSQTGQLGVVSGTARDVVEYLLSLVTTNPTVGIC